MSLQPINNNDDVNRYKYDHISRSRHAEKGNLLSMTITNTEKNEGIDDGSRVY